MSFFKGKFKAVIFDLDGVIIDSEPIHMEIMNGILGQWDVKVPLEEYDTYVGKREVKVWGAIKKNYGLSYEIEEIIQQNALKITEYFEKATEVPIVAGIPELLDALHAEGISCAVGSSSSLTNIQLTLNHIPNKQHFKAIVSGSQVAHGKPYPDIFLKAAETLGVAPADCAVIEDSEAGMQAAKRAGMYCIAYLNPTSGKQDLSVSDKIVHAITELL